MPCFVLLCLLLPGVVSAQSEIFSDGFETGDARDWSAVLPSDTVGPEISLESPVGSTMMLQPELVIAYRDNLSGTDTATLVVELDSVDITATCTVDVAGATCPTPELALGPHEVRMTLADQAGQSTLEVASFERIPDPIPPVLYITEPENQGFINETRLVLYNTTETDMVAVYRDEGVGLDLTTFRLVVDGVAREDCAVGPAEARCPVSLSAAVQHSFSVRIEDREGNLAFNAGTIDVVLDPDAPMVTLLEPTGSAPIFNDEFMPVAFTFSDVGTGVDTARLGVFIGSAEFSRFCRLEPEVENEVRCQILGTFEGPQSLTVRVRDLAGNVGEASLDFVPQIDRAGPDLTFVSPTERWILSGQPIAIEVQFADTLAGVEPGSLRIRFDDEDITDQCTQAADGATCTVSAPALGEHRLAAVIEDQASNFMSARHFFEVVDVLPDFVYPEIAFTAPAEIVAGISMPAITLAYSDVGYGDVGQGLDLGTLRVLLDAVDISASCVASAASATCPSPELAEGEHILIASIEDQAGNRGWAKRTVALTLDLGVVVTEPAPDLITRGDRVDIRGTVAAQTDEIMVGGVIATLSANTFEALDVPLEEGANLLSVVARNAGGGIGSATLRIIRDTAAPQAVIRTPPEGFETAAGQIAVAGDVFDPGGADAMVEEPRVVVNGIPVAVTRGSFFDLVPLLPGENLIKITATDTVGNTRTVRRIIRRSDSLAMVLEDVGGNGQTAGMGESLAEPLVIRLIDRHRLPVANRDVTFEVSRGGGVLGRPESAGRRVTVRTDVNGLAAVPFTLGARAGEGNHEVIAKVNSVRSRVIFCASATAGTPARIVSIAGSNALGALTGSVGTEAPFPLLAQVVDAEGNPVTGVEVIYEEVMGDGHFVGEAVPQPSVTVTTDADGKASARFILGPRAGTNINVVRARFEGLEELPTNFVISGISPGPESETRVTGVVLDPAEVPIEGVTVRLAGTPLAAQTDATGRFVLPGAPVGLITLEIDGSTALRPGAWPSLTFDFTTISGHPNELGKPIHLLPLDTAGGRLVGGTEDVIVPLAGMASAGLTVFAGSATFPDGSHEGTISITQVPRDKTPMIPPRGGAFTMVVTIQPPGVQFDPPARLTLPNTEGLVAGSEIELFRFDHDIGEFVQAGLMRVDDGGRYVESVPGAGIIESGWASPPRPAPAGTVCVPGSCTVCNSAGLGPRFEITEFAIDVSPAAQAGGLPEIVRGTIETKGAGVGVGIAGIGQPLVYRAVVSSSCNTTIRWDFGDGFFADGNVVQHDYATAGIYDVVAIASCESVCRGTFSNRSLREYVPDMVRPKELTFTGERMHTILQDGIEDASYTAPHWKDYTADGDADDVAERHFPVAFTRGSNVGLKASFVLDPQPPFGVTEFAMVRASLLGEIVVEGGIPTLIDDEIQFDELSLIGGMPDQIDLLDLELDWEISFDDGERWFPSGTTDNRVYVTLNDPIPGTPLHETVIDLAVSAARETTEATDAVERIWERFATRNVARVSVDGFNRESSGNAMRYWLTEPDRRLPRVGEECNVLEVMLDPREAPLELPAGEDVETTPLGGIGTCTAWAIFLHRSIKSLGIDGSSIVELRRRDQSKVFSFMVKSWTFVPHLRNGENGLYESMADELSDFREPDCRLGQGKPNSLCIDRGEDGILQTPLSGDDMPSGFGITSGANGICESTVPEPPEGEIPQDIQVISEGQGTPFQRCITPGADGVLSSTPGGDDNRLPSGFDGAWEGVLLETQEENSGPYLLYLSASDPREGLGKTPFGDVFRARPSESLHGQGATVPPGIFGNHFVVQYNPISSGMGPLALPRIYDPSYGAGPFLDATLHRAAAVDGVLRKINFEGAGRLAVKKGDGESDLVYVVRPRIQ